MKATQKIVQQLLTDHPEMRDNDYLLMVTIWKTKSNWFNFFKMFVNGELDCPETIRRSRQRVQQLHPELRGKVYELRQQNQNKIKQELGYKEK